MNKGTLHRGVCKVCGGTFWESYRGARGEDICDRCEARKKVMLNGREIDFDAAVNLMDDRIREHLHAEGFDSAQAFLDAYVAAHAAKFDGEEFTV